MEYLAANIKYPKISRENGTYGTVYVAFCVSPTGVADSFSIKKTDIYREHIVHEVNVDYGRSRTMNYPERTTDPALIFEALRVLSGMAVWKPGTLNGQKVGVHFTIPVKFSFD